MRIKNERGVDIAPTLLLEIFSSSAQYTALGAPAHCVLYTKER